MARKKKVFQQAATFSPAPAGKAESFSDSLKALIHGLFGAKKVYKPTQYEVAQYFLTPREREIAYLAALGFSEMEIADALGMNLQTVRVHVRNVMGKMELGDLRDLREFFSTPPSE
jgi:DNA-binding NarL/FixJ family response regulator